MDLNEAFTPALGKKVEEAIRAAIKDLKPLPAVDRVLTARTTGKWVHCAQVLLTCAPGSHGLVYVNLQKTEKETGLLKTKVHGPETKASKFITAKEEKRLAKAEKRLPAQRIHDRNNVRKAVEFLQQVREHSPLLCRRSSRTTTLPSNLNEDRPHLTFNGENSSSASR